MKPVRKIIYKKIITPFRLFIHSSSSVGIILLACTFFSLLLANSDFSETYLSFLHVHLPWHNSKIIHAPSTLLHFINDGLMAVFFFLAGLEIKKELTNGELSTFSKAILPVVAAIGGMIVPASIYTLINGGTIYQHGWGIPMATDIAFALGIAAMLGKKVSPTLKIFLTALAIIDDLGSIIIIAIFYTAALQWLYLLLSAIIILLLCILMVYKKFNLLSLLLGLLLWYCFYNSGIHATVAGVIFAFLIPTNKIADLEKKLHGLVNYGIMPVFALVNTAIILPADIMMEMRSSLSWGIMAGLVIGKPLGIATFVWLSIKLKFAQLPQNTNFTHIMGVGILAGIGFTMSIFIATIGLPEGISDTAKFAILISAFISIILSAVWFYFFVKNNSVKTLSQY